MEVTVQKLSPVLVELGVEVEASRVHQEMERAYQRVAKTAKVRGFRPGKAPKKVLAHVAGPRVAQEVTERLVEETFKRALADQKVQPVSEPTFEAEKLVDNAPFTYRARFEIVPEIAEVKYDGLEAKRPAAKASDEQLQEALEELRREHATLEPPSEPRGAQAGDVLTVDYSVSVEGAEVPEAGATDMVLELGQGSLLPGIEEALAGKQPDETASVTIDMPASHPVAKLKGKAATFTFTVKDQKVRVLPDLDDEFAKDLGEQETLEELKEAVRGRLEKGLKEQSDNKLAEQLVVALVTANPIEVPRALVEQQTRLTEQEILQRARSQGNQARSLSGELRKQVEADSVVKVRAGLLMAEIAKREGIKIGEEQIEEGLQELAAQSGKNVAKLRAEYREPRQREMLVGMILENKVLDIIEAKANITDE